MYYLFYPVLNSSPDLCAAIVQLYCERSLYYLGLCFSSDLCAAYLYYSTDLTEKLRYLIAPT